MIARHGHFPLCIVFIAPKPSGEHVGEGAY